MLRTQMQYYVLANRSSSIYCLTSVKSPFSPFSIPGTLTTACNLSMLTSLPLTRPSQKLFSIFSRPSQSKPPPSLLCSSLVSLGSPSSSSSSPRPQNSNSATMPRTLPWPCPSVILPSPSRKRQSPLASVKAMPCSTRRPEPRLHSGSIFLVTIQKNSSASGPAGMLMMAIGGGVVAGRVPFSVAAVGGAVDDVPTYVLPGRCESVRNCV